MEIPYASLLPHPILFFFVYLFPHVPALALAGLRPCFGEPASVLGRACA